ncbi:hypothetical protein ACWEIJ_13125 [Lentzea sp. NPDC004789]
MHSRVHRYRHRRLLWIHFNGSTTSMPAWPR